MPAPPTCLHLSPQEKKLLTYIAQDKSRERICQEMKLAKNTVGVMIFNIRAKVGKEYQGPHGLYRYALENKENLK